MSKYKYEKEFMFSGRKLEEVQVFLDSEEAPLDVPAIRDSHRNTVLHHTAYHNQPRILQCYLKYYRKTLDKSNHSISEIKLLTRHFLDQANEEGYTATHYAAYRGNVAVLKLLEKYEANFGLTTNLGMTLLHLAAQGDKPATFLTLHSHQQLPLNCTDSKLSTPLHWASFAGSDKIVQYLLSQPEIQVSPVDVEGMTPLHLASTYGNTRIVKKLLLGGAEREVRSLKGQTALDIADQKDYKGIVKMLDEDHSLLDRLKIICNAKSQYRPLRKSYFYPALFLIFSLSMFLLVFGMIELQAIWVLILQGVLMGSTVLLFGSLVLGGRRVVLKGQDYQQYAESSRIYRLCMVCIRETRPREHHCPICMACIPQYDHHCHWINNCVGKHNLLRFVSLIFMLELSLGWSAYIAISATLSLANQSYSNGLFSIRHWTVDLPFVLYTVAAQTLLAMLFFGVPLLCLLIVQIKNLLLGKTTYERFSKAHQSVLMRQSSLLRNQGRGTIKLSHCLAMCCDREEGKGGGEHASSTTSSFVRER